MREENDLQVDFKGGGHHQKASKHVPEPTLKDSNSRRTLIVMRNMSMWGGESLTTMMTIKVLSIKF